MKVILLPFPQFYNIGRVVDLWLVGFLGGDVRPVSPTASVYGTTGTEGSDHSTEAVQHSLPDFANQTWGLGIQSAGSEQR
jgi:hypothetical protein